MSALPRRHQGRDGRAGHYSTPNRFGGRRLRSIHFVRVHLTQIRQVNEVVRGYLSVCHFEYFDEGFLVRHPKARRITAYGRLGFSDAVTKFLVAKPFAGDPVGEFHRS